MNVTYHLCTYCHNWATNGTHLCDDCRAQLAAPYRPFADIDDDDTQPVTPPCCPVCGSLHVRYHDDWRRWVCVECGNRWEGADVEDEEC